MVHQPGQQLHRQILERQRRPVEKFQHEAAGRDLHERRDRGMAEARVGIPRHRREGIAPDLAAGEWMDDLDRDLGIGPPGQPRDRVMRDLRPHVRHIEPAVAGETGENHVLEAESRSFAAG